MIEKALIVIIFMYSMSFSMIGTQYILGDQFGITMTSMSGVPIKSNLLGITDIDTLNIIGANVTETNATTIRTNPVAAAAEIAYELFLLITGTYIFNMLLLFDVPVVFVAGLILIYVLLMIRAVVGYLRGI